MCPAATPGRACRNPHWKKRCAGAEGAAEAEANNVEEAAEAGSFSGGCTKKGMHSAPACACSSRMRLAQAGVLAQSDEGEPSEPTPLSVAGQAESPRGIDAVSSKSVEAGGPLLRWLRKGTVDDPAAEREAAGLAAQTAAELQNAGASFEDALHLKSLMAKGAGSTNVPPEARKESQARHAEALRAALASEDGISARSAVGQQFNRMMSSSKDKERYGKLSTEGKAQFRAAWASQRLKTIESKYSATEAFTTADTAAGEYLALPMVVEREGGWGGPAGQNNVLAALNYCKACLAKGGRFTRWNEMTGRGEFLYIRAGVYERHEKGWAVQQVLEEEKAAETTLATDDSKGAPTRPKLPTPKRPRKEGKKEEETEAQKEASTAKAVDKKEDAGRWGVVCPRKSKGRRSAG